MSDKQACTKQKIAVSEAELPLSCPPKDDRVWDAHPRVYLPLKEKKALDCPYCGTHYYMKQD